VNLDSVTANRFSVTTTMAELIERHRSLHNPLEHHPILVQKLKDATRMSAAPPPLRSLDELEVSEIFRTQSRDGSRPAEFESTSFLHVDADGAVWFGSLPVRKGDLSLELARAHLEPVPPGDTYPLAPPGLTVSPIQEEGADVYVKRPRLIAYSLFSVRTTLADMLLQEAAALERVRARPHRHLARYHGALVRRGRVQGLVLARYRTTLRARLEDDPPESRAHFDGRACVAALRGAVAHLHGLGLAHNDINPANVMLDGEDAPVLIDFGSCAPFGERLVSTGTPGWMEDEEFETSERSHDVFALGVLEKWVLERTGGGLGEGQGEGEAAGGGM
jgi:hypothetical protein